MDAYEIVFSYRPSWDFEGESGIERFVLDTFGRLVSREIVRQPGIVTPVPPVPSTDISDPEPELPTPPTTAESVWGAGIAEPIQPIDIPVAEPVRPESPMPLRRGRSTQRQLLYIATFVIVVLSVSGLAAFLATGGLNESPGDSQTVLTGGGNPLQSNVVGETGNTGQSQDSPELILAAPTLTLSPSATPTAGSTP